MTLLLEGQPMFVPHRRKLLKNEGLGETSAVSGRVMTAELSLLRDCERLRSRVEPRASPESNARHCTVSVVLDRISVDELPIESFTVPGSTVHARASSSQKASPSAFNGRSMVRLSPGFKPTR